MNSYEEYVETKQSNTLGVIGFILALTCCLAPIGLLLSLIAVFKPPRGFAIAGLIISGLITAIMVRGYMGVADVAKKGGFDSPIDAGEYYVEGFMIMSALNQTATTNGELPTGMDDLIIDEGMRDALRSDPWGTTYRLRNTGELLTNVQNGQEVTYAVYALESAGPDKTWDTPDDILPEKWSKVENLVGLYPCTIPGSGSKVDDEDDVVDELPVPDEGDEPGDTEETDDTNEGR